MPGLDVAGMKIEALEDFADIQKLEAVEGMPQGRGCS